MADRTTRVLSPKIIQDDLNGFAALKAIQGYAPANPAFEVKKLEDSYNGMVSKQVDFAQKEADYKSARDEKVLAEWEFHNKVLGAKEQVIAQYGKSSNEVQAIGLKKKTEYKRRSSRKSST
ncbi:MAG: hypothetical protein Q8M94_05485 [Ignavibacteria bacterium]|nr:hypothetical protein [Ignavibacteria bacterium]